MERNEGNSNREEQRQAVKAAQDLLSPLKIYRPESGNTIIDEEPATCETHYIKKYFESFEFEYAIDTVAEDAKNFADSFIVWQDYGLRVLTKIKTEKAPLALQIIRDITLKKLRDFAAEEFMNAFEAAKQTPARFSVEASDEKNKWRRLVKASTHALLRAQTSEKHE